MSSAQLANLPDVLGMLALIAILVVLQRRRLRVMKSTWLLALLMTVLTQISWYFSKSSAVPHEIFHIFTLNAEMLAGVAFLLYRQEGSPLGPDFIRLLAWTLPALLLIETIYGSNAQAPWLYIACALLGIALGVPAALRYGKSISLAFLQTLGWAVIAWCAYRHDERGAAYTAIGCVYAVAAYNSFRQLRSGSLGRVVVVGTLATWALSSFVHSWVTTHHFYFAFAEEIFSLQRYFVTIGILIVLLEDEIRENERLALHDQLTTLANRRCLEQRLLACIRRQYAALILIDLDGFKAVNDSLGHPAGDTLLCQTAARLSAITGPEDTVARVGGDEFIVVLQRPRPDLADAVRAAIAEPFPVQDSLIHLSASVGTAIFPDDANGFGEAAAVSRLIQIADRRMYAVKHATSSPLDRRAKFSLATPARQDTEHFAPQ